VSRPAPLPAGKTLSEILREATQPAGRSAEDQDEDDAEDTDEEELADETEAA
jgi:hypothetical protein